MQDIQPFFRWREEYIASEDKNSPFFGATYSEFEYTNKIYNYFIHPQWDSFGSSTLYLKVLFVDYGQHFAIIELLGEWNDCIENDVMYLKRDLIDAMLKKEINKFILICDNVLIFHGSDDSYYEEWWDDVKDDGGWICCLNTSAQLEKEMRQMRIQYFVNFGGVLQDVNWRKHLPQTLFVAIEALMKGSTKQLVF